MSSRLVASMLIGSRNLIELVAGGHGDKFVLTCLRGDKFVSELQKVLHVWLEHVYTCIHLNVAIHC